MGPYCITITRGPIKIPRTWNKDPPRPGNILKSKKFVDNQTTSHYIRLIDRRPVGFIDIQLQDALLHFPPMFSTHSNVYQTPICFFYQILVVNLNLYIRMPISFQHLIISANFVIVKMKKKISRNQYFYYVSFKINLQIKQHDKT